ncbi:hypothetical protein CRUP_010061 [Coryphaenoides rupestris]|nr:hypothetical protein CRUP_010061 [Coryphaenoides rupestris]
MALHPLIVPLTLVPLSLVLVLLGPRPSVGDIEGDPYDLNNAPDVYCDDSELEQIPPLPKDTTHFYGRFNKIRHVKNTDFINLNKLRGIDLTGNQISGMDEDVFRNLPQLQQVVLSDNSLQALPTLPVTMQHIDVRNNQLISDGLATLKTSR